MKITEYASIISKNWNNPKWRQDVFLDHIIQPILFRNNNGIRVLEEKWDNLIILDACRYDVFREVIKGKIKGKLEHRISRGTETTGFLLENFNDGKFDDIIYITANPFVDRLLRNRFYKVISVWKHDWGGTGTIPPKKVYEYALYAMLKYPTKRIIIHFIQPHSPYPNGTGECEFEDKIKAIGNEKKFKPKYKLDNELYADIWPYIGMKPLKVDKLKEGYKENIKLVIPYVEKLMDILPGRTVVTADHGEAFGEKIHSLLPLRVYGHPRGVRIEQLIKVPWLIVEPTEKEVSKELEKELSDIKKRFTERETHDIKKIIKDLKHKGKI